MTKTTTAAAPKTARQPYLDSNKPAKLCRARRMAREPAAGAPGIEPASQAPAVSPAAATVSRASTKIASVLELLSRADGATLAELIETTGWLPHTTRAALTGLRKKGHVLAKDKRGEVTCYRITEAA
jgi:hypothetical protein